MAIVFKYNKDGSLNRDSLKRDSGKVLTTAVLQVIVGACVWCVFIVLLLEHGIPWTSPIVYTPPLASCLAEVRAINKREGETNMSLQGTHTFPFKKRKSQTNLGKWFKRFRQFFSTNALLLIIYVHCTVSIFCWIAPSRKGRYLSLFGPLFFWYRPCFVYFCGLFTLLWWWRASRTPDCSPSEPLARTHAMVADLVLVKYTTHSVQMLWSTWEDDALGDTTPPP